MGFKALFGAAAILAGAVAAVTGFGIGSILTPLVSLQTGAKIAIAAVSIPHFAATLLRFLILRRHLDRKVLGSFGVSSALGGLAGAFLHAATPKPALTVIFSAVLIFAGLTGLTGWSSKMRFGPKTAWLAGAVSGTLGGVAGNQGGIRSAAMLGFDLPRQAFVATATAIGLAVDGGRIPVYMVTVLDELTARWPLIGVLTAGVLAGTLFGERLLHRTPEPVFRRIVSGLVLALGIVTLFRAVR